MQRTASRIGTGTRERTESAEALKRLLAVAMRGVRAGPLKAVILASEMFPGRGRQTAISRPLRGIWGRSRISFPGTDASCQCVSNRR